jgi:hypothetical protein
LISRAKISEKPISTTTTKEKLDVLVLACYPKYGGRHRLAKRAGVMTQVVEWLLCKLENLGLHPSTATQKRTPLLFCWCNLDMWKITKYLFVYIYL